MEGLGKAIISAKREGTIQGLKLTQEGDSLTHQQFVDDTMVRGIPTVKEAKDYKQILQDFALAAVTEVSLSKSKVFFSTQTFPFRETSPEFWAFRETIFPPNIREYLSLTNL